MNHSSLLAAILERQHILQEQWEASYRHHGLGALAFLPEFYEHASTPDSITWEYWTTEQIQRYLRKEGGPSDIGQRWLRSLPSEIDQGGFAAVIISNDGDPSVEDVHFYRIRRELQP